MRGDIRLLRVVLLVLVAMAAGLCVAPRSLLLISLDGLRPDYVLKADEHGSKIPHLRRILKDGAHASGVRGILPTVTYPSHTTILTGVWPAKHGIYSNTTFDPLDQNLGGWYWYSEDIKVPTLWEAAAKAGLGVASVSWPVSVGALGVPYLIPEYWRAQRTEDDFKLLRALSTPGLMVNLARRAGPYVIDLEEATAGDAARTKYSIEIMRQKRPHFMTIHLAALDHVQHQTGPMGPAAFEELERLDREVGQLEDAMRANSPDFTISIVSDHGFARTDHSLDLRAAFRDAGLLKVEKGKVVDWKAIPKPDGGSASIILKNPNDEATRGRVEQLLRTLASYPANGIAQVLGPKEIAAYGGWPAAAFWVNMQTNFSVVNGDGPIVKEKKVGGTHGFLPSHPELLASFFIAGPGIKPGLDLGEIDMRAIAPTLAGHLGIGFRVRI